MSGDGPADGVAGGADDTAPRSRGRGAGGPDAEREPGALPTAPDADAAAGGPDLARAALHRARAAARAKGITPGGPARPAVRPRTGPLRSGSGPDARDPVPFGALVKRLVEERGWQEQTAAGRVLGDWEKLVGPEIADHCSPVSLVEGQLVLVAESTAWATQLRLLTRTLQSRLEQQVGQGVVTAVVVRGPTAPDWRRGPRRVRGRGPRDTYG